MLVFLVALALVGLPPAGQSTSAPGTSQGPARQGRQSIPAQDCTAPDSPGAPCKTEAPVPQKKILHAPSGASSEPKKRVIRHGGAKDPNLGKTDAIASPQSQQEIENTKLLLSGTENNLKILADRPAASDLQLGISEMKNYLRQAREALDDGDIDRAHRIAAKASILTNDMVRHP